MTGNMSKSIKYCGNQFDVATLRFYGSQWGWGKVRLDSPRLDLARRLVFGQNGFIYCVPGHKVIKHMPMFWSDATAAVVLLFGTTAGDALCGDGQRDAPSGVR